MPPRVQSRISDHLGARAQYIRTRQFGQHYASQSLTNAADAQQKIAFRLQVEIIVDRQCDGFVERYELAREVRDRRIGQGLSLRVDNAAVLAILPFPQARDDARSDRLQLTQPTVGLRGWCPRRGLEQFTMTHECATHRPRQSCCDPTWCARSLESGHARAAPSSPTTSRKRSSSGRRRK